MKHYVVRTAIHGGGIVSKHSTETLAIDAADKYIRRIKRDNGSLEACLSSYVGVVSAEDYDKLPYPPDAHWSQMAKIGS